MRGSKSKGKRKYYNLIVVKLGSHSNAYRRYEGETVSTIFTTESARWIHFDIYLPINLLFS